MIESLKQIQELIRQKNFKEASRRLQESLASDPKNPDLLSALAYAQIHLQDYELAKNSLDTALKAAPQHLASLLNKSLLHIRTENFMEALGVIQELLRLDDSLPQAFHNKGVCEVQLKKYTEAIKSLQQGLHLAPENIEMRVDLAIACLGASKFEDAQREVENVISNQPEHLRAIATQTQIKKLKELKG